MTDYGRFLESKSQKTSLHGFDPVWMPSILFDFQRHLTEWAIRKGRAALFEDCGLGKGQPAGSPVLTPTGWAPIGSLVVGDRVIASNGKAYPVTGVYPKLEQDTYRVHFSDGASYVVDLDHQHICRTNNDRQRGKPWRVMSTADLLAGGNLRYGTQGKSRNYDIPVVADVVFEGEGGPLPIDPYVIGTLLGDGHFKRNVTLSSADAQLIADVSARLPAGVSLTQKSRYDWKIMTGLTGCRRHPFRQSIQEMGLLGKLSADKFIPREYLLSAPTTRLELLRGLMDTDGYVSREGTCQFYSVSGRLADGVVWLVRSLGGVPTRGMKQTSCDGKPGQPCHVVTFSLATHNPFRLERKADRWNSSPRDNGRWIDRIEFETRQPTVCISVASPDSSYVTEHFIVTHNTGQQLVWAENIVRKTNRPVLVLTPLAVGAQTVREGDKFGVECVRTRDGQFPRGARVVVCNYERLHYLSPKDFSGVVCDESSILKNFDGTTRTALTEFMRETPYRLLCTATAAPNDYTELGTSSECLGELGHMDMLGMFFRSENNSLHPFSTKFGAWVREKWRFKHHARQPFWRWVCSWARAVRKPSDVGFDDGPFTLPPLTVNEHVVAGGFIDDGLLIPRAPTTLPEQREMRKRTIPSRCERVAELVADTGKPAVVWCHMNAEGDLLERLIPGAGQVSGKDSDERKEELFEAFTAGQLRVLVTKPKVGGWGLNWQHCAHETFFPSHSYEGYYQTVRRCWRFGQKNRVVVDVVRADAERGTMNNLKRKADAADQMFSELVASVSDAAGVSRVDRSGTKDIEVPSWLR